MPNNSTFATISHWKNFRMTLVLEGILVGVFSGLIVVFYRFVLEKVEHFSTKNYSFLSNNHTFLPLWFITLALIAFIVRCIIKKEPMTKGSGIPQVEGVLLHQLEMNWWRVIVGKFIGGFLALGAGLSLGREGPSIQLGAAAGQGVSRLLNRPKIEEKYLITGGASAGLAAAFNAPLAGVMFSLEETHKNFSPLVLVTAMSAALTADIVSKEFFGMKPILAFRQLTIIPLEYYLLLALLGVILGIFGVLFNFFLLKAQDFYAWLKWVPDYCKLLIPFILAGIIGLFYPQVLGGGSGLILSLTGSGILFKMALVLLLIKFAFTMLSYGSGAPGGIFLPMLAIGALIGYLYGNILALYFDVNSIYIANFIVLAMAGYFTAVVRAPITGCILISEMTGSLNHLLSLTFVSIFAFVTADLLRSKPVYESLLERILKNKGLNEYSGSEGTKILLEIAVQMGSLLDGKKIKEVLWPSGSLLVSIKRGNEDIIPNGNSLILAGDYLIVLVDESNAANSKKALLKMANK